MKKRIFSMLLAIVMVVGLVPGFAVTASAATTTGTTGECMWSFDDTTDTLTISGTGAMTIGNWPADQIVEVVIESGVTTIGNNAFRNCSSLTSVTIPASVTSIGNYAFSGCTSLKTVNYLGSLEPTVGRTVFYRTEVSAINVPTTYAGDTFGGLPVSKTPGGSTIPEEPTTYTVSVSATPADGGAVSGGGDYDENTSATVTATANEGYTFVNWTENGTAVSTDASYTFTVTTDRELVANFEEATTECEHTWDTWVGFTWSDDNSSATATVKCGVCKETKTESVTASIRTEGKVTCTTGIMTYWKVSYTMDNGVTKGSEKSRVTTPALQHDWSDWDTEGDQHSRYCKRDGCGEPESGDHYFSNPKVEWVVKPESAQVTLECTTCKKTKTEPLEVKQQVTQQPSCTQYKRVKYVADYQGNYVSYETSIAGSMTDHNFTEFYLGKENVEGDCIFAKCSNTECEYASGTKILAIVAPTDAVYEEGLEHTAELLGYTDSIDIHSLEIVYTKDDQPAAPVEAGTYTASVTCGGVTASVTYKVKATVTVENGTGGGEYAEGDTVTIKADAPTGYTFAGWTSEDGVEFADASAATTTFTMPAKDVTIKANWEPVRFYIVLRASAEPGANTRYVLATYDEELKMPTEVFSRPGETINYWSSMGNGDGSVRCDFDGTLTPNQVNTLFEYAYMDDDLGCYCFAYMTAQWKDVGKFGIVLRASAAEGAETKLVWANYGEELDLSAYSFDPPEGYSLSGWNSKGDGNGSVNCDVDGTLTPEQVNTLFDHAYMDEDKLYYFAYLTAQYRANQYTITFETDGGSAVEPITQDYSTDITAPAAPTKTGFDFGGWYADAELTEAYEFSTMPAENITVYAKWNPATGTAYTVKHMLENVSGSGYKLELAETLRGTTNSQTAAIPKTYPGFTAQAFTQTAVLPDGSAVVEIKYDRNTYTVTLVTNGGTIRNENVTEYTYGIGAKLPTDVTRSGYWFGGWYDNEACNGNPVTEISVTDIGNKTFYAKWIYSYIPIITPTYPPVVDGGDNGDVSVSPKNPEKGDTVTITTDPDNGYRVGEITVTDKNGNPVEVIDNGDGTYSYVQPGGKVTISVTYVCDGTHNCPSLAYSDLDSSLWYHKATDYVLGKGLMNGVGNGKFDPNGTTSRAMIVTILWRLEGEPFVNYAMSFEDVASETWYTEAIRWAVSEGIVTGYNGLVFGPNDAITREQLATILYRYEQYKGGGFTGAWMFLLDFTDRNKVSDWAYEAMCWITMHGVINGKGDGILDPKGNAKRCEAAQMLMNYLER